MQGKYDKPPWNADTKCLNCGHPAASHSLGGECPEDDDAYEIMDPKHPRYHDVMADIWDSHDAFGDD